MMNLAKKIMQMVKMIELAKMIKTIEQFNIKSHDQKIKDEFVKHIK